MPHGLAKSGFAFLVNGWPFRGDFFRRVFNIDTRATVDPLCSVSHGPAHRISQNEPDTLIIIDRIGFVAGPEVKDFAVPAFPSATGAKDFAAFKPGNENNLLGGRYGEWFAIHLHVLDFEIAINPTCDRMRRVADPKPLFFACFTPDD